MRGTLVWSTWWEWLNDWAPPQIRMPKLQTMIGKPPCIWEYACKTSHISNHTYAKNSLNIKECQIIRIERLVWAQRPFSHEHLKKNHIYQNKHHWCCYKVCNGVATTHWSQHPHMSSQHNQKALPLSSLTFFSPHSIHLQMAQLTCFVSRSPCQLNVYTYFNHGWMN